LRSDLPATRIQVPEDGYDPASALAAEMFTRYTLPFEAASVLLLATAVGVLVLAKRQRRSSATPRDGTAGGQ
jgi:NADH:ubiquinone oxidoreductase subunit 6 (subunit J)